MGNKLYLMSQYILIHECISLIVWLVCIFFFFFFMDEVTVSLVQIMNFAKTVVINKSLH